MFLNSYHFRTFWAWKIKIFFPNSSHLVEHLQSLFEDMELDSVYSLFMPVLNHKLMDSKVKFMKVFWSADFETGANVAKFPTIISLMEVINVGHKTLILPQIYNPEIDRLKNETHKKLLKELLSSVNQKIKFFPNKFAIKHRHLLLFELTIKYGVKFLMGALKK